MHERYQIIKKLGSGGMGNVWLVEDKQLRTYWAMKELHDAQDKHYHTLFHHEISILTSLNHPQIPRIVDRFKIGDKECVIMDAIDGVSLTDMLLQEHHIDEIQLLDWANQILEILDYLHSKGILYCDLKPENLMITKGGNIMLLDFGVARFKYQQHVKEYYGTIGYAAPEQYTGVQLDERVDIFAFGRLLLALHFKITKAEVLEKIEVCDMSFSEGLQKIIKRCVMTDRNQRYDYVSSIIDDVKHVENLQYDAKELKTRKKKQAKILAFTSCIFLIIAVMCLGGFFTIRSANYKEAMRSQAYDDAIALQMGHREPYQRLYETTYKQAFLEYHTIMDITSAMQKARKDALQRMEDYHLYESDIKHDIEFFYQMGKECLLSNDAYFYERAANVYFPVVVERGGNTLADAVQLQELAMILTKQANLKQADMENLRKPLHELQAQMIQEKNITTQLQMGYLISQLYAVCSIYFEDSDYRIWQTMLKDMFQLQKRQDTSILGNDKEEILFHQWINSFYEQGKLAREHHDIELMKNSYTSMFELLEKGLEEGYENAQLYVQGGNGYLHIFQTSKNKSNDIEHLIYANIYFEKALFLQEGHVQAQQGIKDCERLMTYWRNL